MMEPSLSNGVLPLELPDFGGKLPRMGSPLSPQELFVGLFAELEDHVHFMEPAFRFVEGVLRQIPLMEASSDKIPAACRKLIRAAKAGHSEFSEHQLSSRILRQLVVETAPVGLSDGAWLRGCALGNAVETRTGMHLLKSLMLRFGGPGVDESYAERCRLLLRSVGGDADAFLSWYPEGSGPCSELAYERALLGVGLGLYPTYFLPEIVGYNLWMAALGPCPLLERVSDSLTELGANLRYLARQDRDSLLSLALQAVETLVHGPDGQGHDAAARVFRGFAAADHVYLRWEQAMMDGLASSTERVPTGALGLEGVYDAAVDPESLAGFALRRYAGLDHTELYYCFANADVHPASRLVARQFVQIVFDRIEQVFADDARLNSQVAPPYSEQAVAEMVEEQHKKNVRARGEPNTSMVSSNLEDAEKAIQEVFDGCWVQGFGDVHRAFLEEYGWLFRIYASEHGDGDFSWNHCQIFRRAFESELGPHIMLPKTDPRLYALFDISFAGIVTMAVSLNTGYFLPEILGINLSIESTGVGGGYIDQWKNAERDGYPWKALAWRLHNSIDNYADGHTKWALYAVQAFMRRVQTVAPEQAEEQWKRIWRLWRCRDILVHGAEEEQTVLSGYFVNDSRVLG